jgi:hypothetical protein
MHRCTFSPEKIIKNTITKLHSSIGFSRMSTILAHLAQYYCFEKVNCNKCNSAKSRAAARDVKMESITINHRLMFNKAKLQPVYCS